MGDDPAFFIVPCDRKGTLMSPDHQHLQHQHTLQLVTGQGSPPSNPREHRRALLWRERMKLEFQVQGLLVRAVILVQAWQSLPNRAVKPLTSVTGIEGAPRSGTLSTWIYPYGQIALHGTLVLTRPRKALVGRPRTCSNMQRNLSLLFVGCNAVPGVGRKSQRGVSTDGRPGFIALVTVTS